jgi:hypothetical protein
LFAENQSRQVSLAFEAKIKLRASYKIQPSINPDSSDEEEVLSGSQYSPGRDTERPYCHIEGGQEYVIDSLYELDNGN